MLSPFGGLVEGFLPSSAPLTSSASSGSLSILGFDSPWAQSPRFGRRAAEAKQSTKSSNLIVIDHENSWALGQKEQTNILQDLMSKIILVQLSTTEVTELEWLNPPQTETTCLCPSWFLGFSRVMACSVPRKLQKNSRSKVLQPTACSNIGSNNQDPPTGHKLSPSVSF